MDMMLMSMVYERYLLFEVIVPMMLDDPEIEHLRDHVQRYQLKNSDEEICRDDDYSAKR